MSFIEYAICPREEAVDEVISLIARIYGKRDLTMESSLEDFFELLEEKLYFFIEYPYVDRIYRDSYYTYFSSKHNDYYRDCIRLSIFDMPLKPMHFRRHDSVKALQNAFRGFIIIRPTFPNIIGRTVIDPMAFKKKGFQICHYSTEVLINGIKLRASGFPFSSQDGESISCAETTVWGIMEYFGNKYADYQPVGPSKIINVLNRYSKKRLIPSAGLTVDQISIALKEFGFGTQIYASDDAYESELKNIISIYIESGIPIIAAIENDQVGHAILLIGHENDNFKHFDSAIKRELDFNGIVKKYIDYSDLPKRFIVNDDNLTPYRSISLDNPAEHYKEDDDFKGCEITSVVVPLHKKVYLDVLDAKKLVLEILTDNDLGYEFGSDFVFRFFLASSRSLKHHVSCLQGFPENLKDCIVGCKMPKFIWCGEIYSKGNFLKNSASALIIVDATEANNVWTDSLIFAGYPNKCIVRFNKDFVNLPYKFTRYSKFINNLR